MNFIEEEQHKDFIMGINSSEGTTNTTTTTGSISNNSVSTFTNATGVDAGGATIVMMNSSSSSTASSREFENADGGYYCHDWEMMEQRSTKQQHQQMMKKQIIDDVLSNDAASGTVSSVDEFENGLEKNDDSSIMTMHSNKNGNISRIYHFLVRSRPPITNKMNFMDKGLWNVVNLGVSFFLMFSSYETTQNFLTTIREEEGFVALFILYAMFAFASFLSPSFCQVVGVKPSLLIASTGYALFVFSAAIDSAGLLYFAAGFDGFCAGLLWTAQASMLTRSATYSQNVRRRRSPVVVVLQHQPKSISSNDGDEIELKEHTNQEKKFDNLNTTAIETTDTTNTTNISGGSDSNTTNNSSGSSGSGSGELLGLYSGIFFALFQANYIAGNLLAGILIAMGISNSLIFIILGIICIVGCMTLFGLRPMDKKYLSNTTEIQPTNTTNSDSNTTETSEIATPSPPELKGFAKLKEQTKEFLFLVKGTVLVLFSKKMIIFSFISIYSGYSQAFFYGTLPPIIGKQMVGWVMIFFGIVQVISALLSGKLNDFVGRRISMCMGLIIHALAIAISFQMVYWGDIYKPTNGIPIEVLIVHFITMGLFAAGDAFLTNSIYSILGSKNYYKKKYTTESFSAFRFIQANSSAAGFIIPIFVKKIGIQIVMVVTFLLCVLAFIGLDAFVAPVDKKSTTSRGRRRKSNQKDETDNEESIEKFAGSEIDQNASRVDTTSVTV